jgi:hypothetical protein
MILPVIDDASENDRTLAVSQRLGVGSDKAVVLVIIDAVSDSARR